MPKLLIFAPCEKIIIDDQGNATLIVIMQNVSVSVSEGSELPRDAVTPKEWAVFTLWQPMPEDAGQKFVQVLQALMPDRSEFKRGELSFEMQENKTQQNRINIVGFPIGQPGQITVNMWLEVDSEQVGETYSFPLTVTHIHQKKS